MVTQFPTGIPSMLSAITGWISTESWYHDITRLFIEFILFIATNTKVAWSKYKISGYPSGKNNKNIKVLTLQVYKKSLNVIDGKLVKTY